MKKIIILAFFISAIAISYTITSSDAYAHRCYPGSGCTHQCCPSRLTQCKNACVCVSNNETEKTIQHTTQEFINHRNWMVNTYFKQRILPAMQMMTAQLNSIALLQVQVIGSFFDAKHQLETQRLFQTLTARVHKDYHPSDGLCRVGTFSRSLAGSNEKSNMDRFAMAESMVNRAVMGTDSTAFDGSASDEEIRLVNFIKTHCSDADNNQNLSLLCRKGSADPKNANLDINYTRTIETPKTIDVDFLKDEASTIDEKSVIALSKHLFANQIFPKVSKNNFLNAAGEPSQVAGEVYMDARSYLAKQSVAMHSFASIAALKAKGEEGAQPFIYALLNEMGGNALSAQQIMDDIGEAPSYNAQMEVLTKTLYQRPEFYSDLYDKPANVMRKQVAIQAATLMQKRDLYDSFLRSEMSLAVMLETLLMKQQSELTNEVGRLQ